MADLQTRFRVYRGDTLVDTVRAPRALAMLNAFAKTVDPPYATVNEIAAALDGGFCGLARGCGVVPMVAIAIDETLERL